MKMNRSYSRARAGAVLLALCLMITILAGCTTEPVVSPAPTASAAPVTTPAPTSGGETPVHTETPEIYMYQPQYIPLQSEIEGMVTGMYSPDKDGRLLVCSVGTVGSNTPEGVTPEFEGQYDVTGILFYRIAPDGSVEKLEKYQNLETADGAAPFSYAVSTTPEGQILSLESVFRSWYDGPDDEVLYSAEWYNKGYQKFLHTEENYYLRRLASDGSEVMCANLTDRLAGLAFQGFFPRSVAMDGEGRCYVNGGVGILVLDRDGTELGMVEAPGAYFTSVLCLKDGRPAVLNQGMSMTLRGIDPETLELDDSLRCVLPGLSGRTVSTGGGDYDLYYTSGTNFLGCRLEDGTTETILNWLNADVDSASVLNGAWVLADGRILTTENLFTPQYGVPGEEPDLVILSQVPASSIPEKTVLTLATVNMDFNMQSLVTKFNRSDPDFRIEVRDYAQYTSQDDPNAPYTKLAAEIMAGNVPDILDLSGMPQGKLGARGLLLDLLPFLEADEELNGALFESVLNAVKTDGKLYRTVGSFQLISAVGASSVVGDTPGWTLAEMNAALKTMPEGCEPFNHEMTRNQIFNAVLTMELNKLVDWEKGECYFDSPLFLELLDFAAQFPESVEFDPLTMEDEPTRIASGKQMLAVGNIYDFNSFQMYNAYFGVDTTWIGFPMSEGVGSEFQIIDGGYGITSACAHPEAAWRFLRKIFTKDYQLSLNPFPINREAYDVLLEKAMTPTYMRDENGNILLDASGEKIEMPKNHWPVGSQIVDFFALTQEEADQLMDLIQRTDCLRSMDQTLLQKITQECQPFFAGQKAAEEVARLLQSKISIYLSEQG